MMTRMVQVIPKGHGGRAVPDGDVPDYTACFVECTKENQCGGFNEDCDQRQANEAEWAPVWGEGAPSLTLNFVIARAS